MERFPRQRMDRPGDLDTTLLYLVDPGSHVVTGACVTVDDVRTPRWTGPAGRRRAE